MTLLRKVLIFITLMSSISAVAAGSEEKDWNSVIDAIVEVESGGNPNAKSGNCVGPMQISPILVKECNQILRSQNSTKRYTLADRTSLEKCKEMFLLFQQKYNPTNNVEWAIRAWNGGPRFTKKSTDNYYRKVTSKIK